MRGLNLLVYQRLNDVFLHALPIDFDNTSRMVFISDVHRGDNGTSDQFAPNKPLFLQVLDYYYRQGYTYIEVGDGDDAWKYRNFERIRKAHLQVFKRLHQFYRENRLFIVVGNHDYEGNTNRPVWKDGLPTNEGLRLQHRHTGQEIFVTHGHQADFACDRFSVFSRLLVRHFWRRWQNLGFGKAPGHDAFFSKQSRSTARVESRIKKWVMLKQQAIICGHTHRPTIPAADHAPYFNTGSCIHPGHVTSLELMNSEMRLVRWEADSLTSPTPTIRRLPIAPHFSLGALFPN